MKLFIANCTKTHKELNFTVREVARTLMTPIKIGHQVQVWKDSSKEELEYIVDQLRKYGLVEANEAYKAKHFVGLCYSFEKPVKAELLEAMIEKNYQLLDDEAQENRMRAALVLDHSIKKEMQEAGMPGGLRELSVSVTEESRPGENIGKSPTNEVISVNPSAVPAQEGVRKQRTVRA